MKVALTNLPAEHADAISKVLVEGRFTACVNMCPVSSVYRWEGRMCVDREVMLIMKLATEGVDALRNKLVEVHPYSVPEFIVIDIDNSLSLTEYVSFVRSETGHSVKANDTNP